MIQEWGDLPFFESGEWDVIQEKLNDIPATELCPLPQYLLTALDVCPLDTVRVAIFGQDPYPNQSLCTGVAFSIPNQQRTFPPTLSQIFDEYCDDLHYPRPTTGDLTPWCKQGVLLWNTIPSLERGKSLSHEGWVEYQLLNQQMVEELNKRSVVFVLIGSIAKRYIRRWIDTSNCDVIETSHPSPRAQLRKHPHPFKGSRIFTTINDYLCRAGGPPIDWRLT